VQLHCLPYLFFGCYLVSMNKDFQRKINWDSPAWRSFINSKGSRFTR